MNKLKKNYLIKARKLCNIFRFIDDLNSINDGGELESNYSNMYPEELQLGKENTDNMRPVSCLFDQFVVIYVCVSLCKSNVFLSIAVVIVMIKQDDNCF